MNSQIPQWVVVLDSSHGVRVYGPTDDEETARDFARFLTAEARKADDTPDEIRSLFGPLQLVHRPDVAEVAVPF